MTSSSTMSTSQPPGSSTTKDTSSPSGSSSSSACCRQNRIRFALFIKVLLKLIEDKLIRDQAKTIVQSYVKKNKHTNSHRSNSCASAMEEDMEFPLRELVGDSVWLCAKHYTQLYFQQKKKSPTWRRPTPPSLPRSTSTSSAEAISTTISPSTSSSIYEPASSLLESSPTSFTMIKQEGDCCYDQSLPEPLLSLLNPSPLRLLPARPSFPSLSNLANGDTASSSSEEEDNLLVFQPLPPVSRAQTSSLWSSFDYQLQSRDSSSSTIPPLLVVDEALLAAI